MDLATTIRLACLLEAAAPKPGNVHPGAAFDDADFRAFVRSADAIAPVLARADRIGVGRAILDAVIATRAAAGTNTNLGIILLLAPLAAVPREQTLREGVASILTDLTREDASLAFEAIRRANPGGLGAVPEQDASREPTVKLLEAMRLAADRDAIAAEYTTRFAMTLNTSIPVLASYGSDFHSRWQQAVVHLHLVLMSKRPDTLIARKCGRAAAVHSGRLAGGVLNAGWPETDAGRGKLVELDQWLRADGNRRNPGTMADLVCAGLFTALREQVIRPPASISDVPMRLP